MIDPHLAHWAGGGLVDRRLNTSSILEWRLWGISLRYSPGQNGNDQYCSLLRTEGLALASLFSRGRTSAKMPVQATLLPVSCAPLARQVRAARTAFVRCRAKHQLGGPEERRAGIRWGEVNPVQDWGRVSGAGRRSVRGLTRVGGERLLILRQMVNRERVDVTAALSRYGGRRKPSRATISW